MSNERAKAVSSIDVQTNKVLNVIAFRSETGMPRYDAPTGKLYVNLQDLDRVAIIDVATDAVEREIPLPGCRANHGMALDSKNRRAFIACQGNNVLIVLDLDKLTVIARIETGRGSDFVEYDAGMRRIYVPCSDGTMTIVQQDDADHHSKLETFPVSRGVHTVAVDPVTHRVYVPEQLVDGRPAARLSIYEPVTP